MSNSIQIFGQDINGKPCVHCERAKNHLTRLNIEFAYRDIGNAADRKEMFERVPDAKTVPQIFIGRRHIGGADDLIALSLKELQQMIGG